MKNKWHIALGDTNIKQLVYKYTLWEAEKYHLAESFYLPNIFCHFQPLPCCMCGQLGEPC